MKRRTFLTASGTIGIVGAVSGTTIVSSVYSNLSTSVLLEDFTPKTKIILDDFLTDVKLNAQALGIDEKFAKQIVMPVQIISKTKTLGSQNITYKNKSGEYISLTLKNGVRRIEVLKSL